MNPIYAIENLSEVYSPGLIFYRALIERNLEAALRLAGGPARLRPHVKTHKTREIVQLERKLGIDKHKCATLAEAEMLASCGVPDVFLAYNLVGPNCLRMARLAEKYSETRFAVTADDLQALQALSHAVQPTGQTVDVVLDLDVGQHRTGMPIGEQAATLYQQIARSPGLRPGGFHVYDGHHHQPDPAERTAAVQTVLEKTLAFRDELEKHGLPVPRIVAGGTPTFPIWSQFDFPGLELAPGTFVLHDHNYGSKFPDLSPFVSAALLVTRVISRPTSNRVTFDLGYKAVASDPPAGKRLTLLDLPDAVAVLQNEEHLVIETSEADRFHPGDVAFAIPAHVCPTCAMHRSAYIVDNQRVVGQWDILARDRMLTV